MLENIILWVIIALAAIYCGRNVYRVMTGKSKGCCGDCDPTESKPQQSIPDFTDKKDN
jgi:hypothetical protein